MDQLIQQYLTFFMNASRGYTLSNMFPNMAIDLNMSNADILKKYLDERAALNPPSNLPESQQVRRILQTLKTNITKVTQRNRALVAKSLREAKLPPEDLFHYDKDATVYVFKPAQLKGENNLDVFLKNTASFCQIQRADNVDLKIAVPLILKSLPPRYLQAFLDSIQRSVENKKTNFAPFYPPTYNTSVNLQAMLRFTSIPMFYPDRAIDYASYLFRQINDNITGAVGLNGFSYYQGKRYDNILVYSIKSLEDYKVAEGEFPSIFI